MAPRTEFVYLSEADLLQAGVLHTTRCIDVCEEVFRLLATGDYLMGGSNHNSHGIGLVFPTESPFPNMPLAGPDRRFVAMPAYLGGRFDVCGNKWYGSNAANPAKGLPRSVLTLTLNDKDTGEPLSFMSANLISSARTGAVPAVASRYLAQPHAQVAVVIGCGPINRACYRSIASQLPALKRVLCYDLFTEKAQQFAEWSQSELDVPGEAVTSLPEALADGDVVTVAASRLKPLHVEDAWFKTGATVLVSGPLKADDAFWTNSEIVYDNIGLHEAYVEDAVASPDKHAYYDGVIGGPLYSLIDRGELPALHDSVDLGNVIIANRPGRTEAGKRMLFVASGMAVFDVGWGFDLYQTALEKGIGQRLILWDQPHVE
jgi:ornithine cyclodeaminase/alanine dehydrogenase-like protein (mu-crystallin family)